MPGAVSCLNDEPWKRGLCNENGDSRTLFVITSLILYLPSWEENRNYQSRELNSWASADRMSSTGGEVTGRTVLWGGAQLFWKTLTGDLMYLYNLFMSSRIAVRGQVWVFFIKSLLHEEMGQWFCLGRWGQRGGCDLLRILMSAFSRGKWAVTWVRGSFMCSSLGIPICPGSCNSEKWQSAVVECRGPSLEFLSGSSAPPAQSKSV